MVADEKFARELFDKKLIKDLYILSRYYYSLGIPILSDKTYDTLDQVLKKRLPDWEYCKRTYDDDPIPIELLRKHGLEVPDTLQAVMDEEQSKSIQPVFSYEDAWEWFKDKRGLTLVFSTKVDGINTKNLYRRIPNTNKFKYIASRTRGRSGSSMDITPNVSKVLPSTITIEDTDDNDIWVRAEAFCPPSKLQLLRDLTSSIYATPRSAGISLLRVENRPQEELECLTLTVFKTSSKHSTIASIDEAHKQGFNTVPYILSDSCPDTYNEFKVWLKGILDEVRDLATVNDLPTDGVVVEVDDQSQFFNFGEHNQYFGGNLALKIEQWAPGIYTSTLKEIIVEQKKGKFSFVGIIEPVLISSGNTVTRVNLFNLSVIQQNKIKIGSTIQFQYKSESAVDLIYQ